MSAEAVIFSVCAIPERVRGAVHPDCLSFHPHAQLHLHGTQPLTTIDNPTHAPLRYTRSACPPNTVDASSQKVVALSFSPFLSIS